MECIPEDLPCQSSLTIHPDTAMELICRPMHKELASSLCLQAQALSSLGRTDPTTASTKSPLTRNLGLPQMGKDLNRASFEKPSSPRRFFQTPLILSRLPTQMGVLLSISTMYASCSTAQAPMSLTRAHRGVGHLDVACGSRR